jgi:hypothetical protein
MKLSSNMMVTHGEYSIIERAINAMLETEVFDEILILLPPYTARSQILHDTISLYDLRGVNIIKTFPFEWTNDFALARNYLLQRSKNDYVYWQDADTVIAEPAAWKEIVNKIDSIKPDHVKVNHRCYTPIFKDPTIQQGDLDDISGYRLNSSHMHKHIIRKDSYTFYGKHHEEPVLTVEKKIKSFVVNGVNLDHKPLKDPIISVKRNIAALEKLVIEDPKNIAYEWSLNRDKYIVGDFSCIPHLRNFVLDKKGNHIIQYSASLLIAQYNLGVLLEKYDYKNSEHKTILSETETFLRIAMSLCEVCAEPYSLLGDVYILRCETYIAIDFFQKAMHMNIDNGFEAQKNTILYKEYPAMRLSQIYAEHGQLELSLLNNSYHLECLENKPIETAYALNFRYDLLEALNGSFSQMIM